MLLRSGVANPVEIDAAIAEIVRLMAPDVVRIRYDIGPDWSGDSAVSFRVLLSDERAETRLHEVAKHVVSRLEERLDFESMDVFAYYNFRTVSEQAALKEEAWA